MSDIHLAIGTNLGQREQNLQTALDELGLIVAVERISPIYETEPWGIREQPDFLNICVSGKTNLEPRRLLEACKKIEQKLGREQGPRYGPRVIDIDILFYEDLVKTEPDLILPHPRIVERAFVLAPLVDIDPELRHPITKETIEQMTARVDMMTVRKVPRRVISLRRPINLAWGVKTYVMGIINATSDSFSGDGIIQNENWVELAVNKAKSFVDAGVDLLDIGGESTRPGGSPVPEEMEIARILPVIKAIRSEVDVPLSIDTYRANVAETALQAGADWVNDVWGLRMDPNMVDLIATAKCPVIIMHNRSRPKNVQQEESLGGRYIGIEYQDLLKEISRELQESINLALARGVDRRNIIIDPGIGFGKTVNQNLRLINELPAIKELGYPLLVGPSRKSFIGFTLNLPPEERLEGTAAAVVIAIDRGVDIVRVHDATEMVRVAKMTDKIIHSSMEPIS